MKLLLLGAKALTHRSRRGIGLEWGCYARGGEGRRLKGHSYIVRSLAKCEGKMCSWSLHGLIPVWNTATLEQARVMKGDGDDAIFSLAMLEGEVISGYVSGRIWVWDNYCWSWRVTMAVSWHCSCA